MIKQLNINGYETCLILGNNNFEKLKARRVVFNISLRFFGKNDACDSDDLRDTVCYSALISFLNEKLKNTQFNLIERAAQFLYDEISNYLNNKEIQKRVEIIKPKPFAKNLKSASFICSDW